MRKSILFILAILISNFALSQQKFNAKEIIFSKKQTIFFTDITSGNRRLPEIITTPAGIFEIFPDTRIFASAINQSTISSSVRVDNNNFIIVGANTDLGIGYYYSSNGGLNWAGNNFLPGSFAYSQNPSALIDNSGKIYFNYYDNYLTIDKSTNLGLNWLGRTNIISTYQFDKNIAIVDTKSTSPYFGRIYTAWTKWGGNYSIMFSYSSNGGSTFTNEVQIGSPLSGHYEQGADLQTGSNGQIYCVWAAPQTSNNIEDKIGFTFSSNGGTSFTAPTTPIDISGIRGTLLTGGIRVQSFPSLAVDNSGTSSDGNLYITWAQKNLSPAGSDADILFSKSTNSGLNWSIPVRVNNDALNNGKLQFMPSIAVDAVTGNIAIVFYDNRDNVHSDSVNTYVALSANSGSDWINLKVSSKSQKPIPIDGYATGYFTDKIDLIFNNNIVYPFWADNRFGPVQIYTSKIIIGPVIQHTPVKDLESTSGPFVVNAEIIPFGSQLQTSGTKVFWGRGSITDSIMMTNSSGNNWFANIPGNSNPSEYRYYIKTIDNLNRTTFSPAGAPDVYHRFFAGTDTVKPVITHSPIADTPRSYWPLKVKAYATDNIGVDTVWVSWYKNSVSTGYKTFGLSKEQGILYSGDFNSLISEINFEDSIFYRIHAKDNSTSHNVDSTSLIRFIVEQLALIKIGNGNLISGYPFSTFYTDSRTDMLYLASEINSNGGGSGWITKIWFNFNSAPAITLNNLSVKIQNTTASTITGFTSSGWTSVYSGNYIVPGTGWRDINLQTPYNWNGTTNLLIEVCYDNNSFGANTNVFSTNTPNMTWHQHQDLVSGSGCADLTSGSLQNSRPNTAFTIMLHLGVKKITEEIPKYFMLEQNYPNPFNPVTKIKFSVKAAEPNNSNQNVTLDIYDLLGRQLTTLVNNKLSAGIYEVTFNASNLTSGIYFYRLKCGNYSETKRMIYMK